MKRRKGKKPKHGPNPTYETRNSTEKRATDEYAWLLLPDPARVYDSSLSKPGRICRRCRSFVAGNLLACPECFAP